MEVLSHVSPWYSESFVAHFSRRDRLDAQAPEDIFLVGHARETRNTRGHLYFFQTFSLNGDDMRTARPLLCGRILFYSRSLFAGIKRNPSNKEEIFSRCTRTYFSSARFLYLRRAASLPAKKECCVNVSLAFCSK